MNTKPKPYSLYSNQTFIIKLKRWFIQALTHKTFQPSDEVQPMRTDTRAFALWLGRRGEAYSCWWLRRHKGMIILDRNFRNGPHEIDIIARDGKVLVFVEVRTLSSDHLQLPSASISKTKRKNLHLAASAWRKDRGYRGLWRMDIIGIVWPIPEEEPSRVDHWVKSL